LNKKNNKEYLISSIVKALDVILILSSNEDISIRKLGEKLNISKSTLHRILRTLEHKNFVRQDIKNKKYSLGLKFYELGNKIKDKFKIRNISYPFMKDLNNLYQETVQLAIIDKETILIVESIEGTKELRVFAPAGRRLPITYGNFGKIFLAQMPYETILDFLKKYPLKKYAKNSIVDEKLFLQEIENVKIKGIAVGIDDPIDTAFTVAVPIFGYNKDVIASIGLSGAKIPKNMGRLQQIELSLKEISRQISAQLGLKI